MKTTILCYGDSNTYGYDPRSYLGSRYPKENRWTGRLQKKINAGFLMNDENPTISDTKKHLAIDTDFRTSVQIKNLGVPGREIPRFEYEMKQVADVIASHLPVFCEMQNDALGKSAKNQPALLCLWIMLGTNDLLSSEIITAEEVAGRMKVFLDFLTRQECFQNGRLKIRLIAPPKMQPGTWVSAHALEESARLGDCMKAIVPAGVAFTDAGQWELPVCFDGVHLTAEGHRVFAEEILKTFTFP